MIMKFALLLGYTAAALGMSMPTKDALPVRATTFSSVPALTDFKPTINKCGSSSRTKIIWEHDAHVDDVTVAIMLAKSEKYELDTMIISSTGDSSTSLVGGNNFLRLLSLLGMHDVKVGLSRPEEHRVDYPNPLNRAADTLAGVIEDLPYYPKSVNKLNGSDNYGVDAYDLSKRDPECTPATCKGPIDATWRTRPTSTKYYKEALDHGVTTVLVTGTLTALNNVLRTDANNTLTNETTPEGLKYFKMIDSVHMMMGSYWKQPISAYNLNLYKQDYEAASADCKAHCTYDHANSNWTAACSSVNYTCDNFEGNSYMGGDNVTANVLAHLSHAIVKTVPWSTTNWVGNCPDEDYLRDMKHQMNKENGTKESQLVLDMMKNLVHDATQYNWGGFLTGGYCFYDQLGYYGLYEPDAFTWEPEDIYVTDDGTFTQAEEGYYTATIQIGTINTTEAHHFRDEFMPGELTKRCIHHQPPSFKELQQYYDCKEYGRTCHGGDDN